MPRWLKRGLIVFGCLVVVFGVGMAVLIGSYFSKYEKVLKELTWDKVDVSRVGDGVYEGWFDGGPVKAKVRVTVAGGKITDLTILRHDNGRGSKAESIVKTVMQAQSLAVDTVSGATSSSKVILKATELALTQGLSNN